MRELTEDDQQMVQYLLETLTAEVNEQIEDGQPLLFLDEDGRDDVNRALEELDVGIGITDPDEV